MERETQSATGGLMRMLSCVALPKVGNDDGDLISPRAEPAQPTAPLVNPGTTPLLFLQPACCLRATFEPSELDEEHFGSCSTVQCSSRGWLERWAC